MNTIAANSSLSNHRASPAARLADALTAAWPGRPLPEVRALFEGRLAADPLRTLAVLLDLDAAWRKRRRVRAPWSCVAFRLSGKALPPPECCIAAAREQLAALDGRRIRAAAALADGKGADPVRLGAALLEVSRG